MQSVDELGRLPVMQDGASLHSTMSPASKPGTMPGLIERYNGQHVVSLTANMHGITLGEAAANLKPPSPRRRSAPRRHRPVPRRDSAARANHLRTAHRPAPRRPRDLPAARRQLPVDAPGARDRADHSRRALRRAADAALTGTTLNIQSFMGAIMAIGIAVANSILLVTFAERARHEGQPLLTPRAKAPPAACAPS